jgi:hypothetical protein
MNDIANQPIELLPTPLQSMVQVRNNPLLRVCAIYLSHELTHINYHATIIRQMWASYIKTNDDSEFHEFYALALTATKVGDFIDFASNIYTDTTEEEDFLADRILEVQLGVIMALEYGATLDKEDYIPHVANNIYTIYGVKYNLAERIVMLDDDNVITLGTSCHVTDRPLGVHSIRAHQMMEILG